MPKLATAAGRGAGVTCSAVTLNEALEQFAHEHPDTVHLTVLQEDGHVRSITYSELYDGARAVAAALVSRGIRPQDTVALMLPTGQDFFFSFMGILFAGAVPVPIYPPAGAARLEEYAERQSRILRNADARALITFRQAERLARLLKPRIPSLNFVVRTERLRKEGTRLAYTPARVTPESFGLIQYTSGSTGLPKGVVLSHANLLANVRAIGDGVAVQPDDVVVCWLPLYHDMGLIGCWLFSLCHKLPLVVMSPLSFLRRPERWLWALHAYRGTLSPAPNFAFELCVRKVPDDAIEGLDLSRWRVALNGAEPINPVTIERFVKRFGPRGFRPAAMMPVYGLAESTVALTFHPVGQSPQVDVIERETFRRSRKAVPVSGSSDNGDGDGEWPEALRFISVGHPVLDHEVRIVNDDGRRIGERTEGHIEFRGPSATPGYYRNPEATRAIRTDDGWLRTGDLGYLGEGDLFITGRSKDLIIKGGRNIYPQEVESVAAEIEGIRAGCVAAFSVPNQKTGSEGLVVVAETRRKNSEVRESLTAEIRRNIASVVKISPDDVRLVPPHTIPKTPSGKLRRAECRRLYLEDKLHPDTLPAWLQIVRVSVSSAWAAMRGTFDRDEN